MLRFYFNIGKGKKWSFFGEGDIISQYEKLQAKGVRKVESTRKYRCFSNSDTKIPTTGENIF